MSETVVASRYAEALFQIGQEKGTTDLLNEQLNVLKEVIETNAELMLFLTHPAIKNDDKKQFLDKVFPDVERDIVNTFKLLVERRHTDIILSIIRHFNEMNNDAKGIAVATVYSVRALLKEEIDALELNFTKRLNMNKVIIKNEIDKTILGGLKIVVGNRVYDGSVSGKLKRLERQISTVNK